MHNKQWITTKELAEIKNISERGVRKSFAKNKYITKKSGRSYEVLVTSLEENIREKLTVKSEILHPLAEKNIEVSEAEKQLALAKYDLVQKWDEYRNKEKTGKSEAGKEFLELYNRELVHKDLFKKVGRVAIGTIYEWDKKLKRNNDNYQALIKGFIQTKKQKVTLKPQEEDIFLKLLLDPRQMNIAKATHLTKRALQERGITDLHCDMTYRRFAKKFIKENYDAWVFAREGIKALNDKVVPYIPRDISVLEVGDVLVADGHRLAFQVINPFTGKPCRPTLVAYQDWKSGAMVGFEIMIEESTQCIASALRNAIINLGKIPSYCYHDNGKANKSNYFNGVAGLFSKLVLICIK